MAKKQEPKTKVKVQKFESKGGAAFAVASASPVEEVQPKGPKTAENIQAVSDSIEEDKNTDKVLAEAKKSPHFLEDEAFYHVPDGSKLAFITGLFENQFNLRNVGFQDGMTDWNYPDALDGRGKHQIWRCYNWDRTIVDVFNAGTDKAEILRIKAGMEALGFRYTWVTGEDLAVAEDKRLDEEKLQKLLFVTRLKPCENKVKAPQSLSDAGFAEPVSYNGLKTATLS